MKKMTMSLVLITALLTLLSCGQKNTVKSNSLGNSVFSSGISYNANVSATLSSVASTYSCSRKASLVYGYGQSGLTTSTISGTTGETYVGVNKATKDIMVVTKMYSGSTVIGYNFEISYCASSSYTPPYFESRTVSGFAFSGMTFGTNALSSGLYPLYVTSTTALVAAYTYSNITYPAMYLYTAFTSP